MVTWNERKRKQVIKDHGIDFENVADVFQDPFGIDFEDTEHSTDEPRRAVIGKTIAYGLILLIYVVREDDIRCITARKAERWMVRMYEKQRKRI